MSSGSSTLRLKSPVNRQIIHIKQYDYAADTDFDSRPRADETDERGLRGHDEVYLRRGEEVQGLALHDGEPCAREADGSVDGLPLCL